MECYKVKLPEDAKLIGTTATGEPAQVYPGEYLVHLLRPKVPVAAPAVLRFVGADVTGRDVHVPIGRRGDPRCAASEFFARVDADGHGAAAAACAA